MTLLREPLLTHELLREEFHLEEASTYLYRSGLENRSDLPAEWSASAAERGVRFVHVDREDRDSVSLSGIDSKGATLGDYVLRDQEGLQRLCQALGKVYLDITGLSYSTWAPLLKALLSSGDTCCVVYVEPTDYRRHETPSRGLIYDLSEKIEGIAPIPGFASLRRKRQEDWALVPLLGFEGARLAHVIESSEPPSERVVPVVGLPGFRVEFPEQALIANRLSLEDEFLYRRIRYAKANCPFDLFQVLDQVQQDYSHIPLRIAPVGTKPHGLGAVLFALSRPASVEIIYDHPRRKSKRTDGAARVCVYEAGVFSQSNLFKAGHAG